MFVQSRRTAGWNMSLTNVFQLRDAKPEVIVEALDDLERVCSRGAYQLERRQGCRT